MAGYADGYFWCLETRKLSKVELPPCEIVSIERAIVIWLQAFLKRGCKICVVWILQSKPIVRRANIVQHTSLRMRYGDGFGFPSGTPKR